MSLLDRPYNISFLIGQFQKITDTQQYELPSVFAERVRYLSSELTNFPGKFSYDRFPYLRKIVDCFSPLNPIREVVFMKGAQIGSTVGVLETILLYNIMAEPKSQMYVNVDTGLMKTSVQTRIEKMIDNAGARHLIFSQSLKKKGSRDTGDTANAKEYPGGFLHFYGSKSPKGFRDKSYICALIDELDAYPDFIKGEGEIVSQIKTRTKAYTSKRKIFYSSTPLVKQTSKIEKLFLEGDQQKFFVACKHCGTMQELVWHGIDESDYVYGIIWENDNRYIPIRETIAYKCKNPNCGRLMKNYDKPSIIPKGEWRATAKSERPELTSFHLNSLYSPVGMYSWEDMVSDWSACWDIEHNRIKDKEKYRVFRNTGQGLTFEESGVQIRREQALQFRRFGFPRGKVPNKMAIEYSGSPILIVITSVDVQKTKLYVDVKGYSTGGVTWTLDFFSIDGDTETFSGPWDTLSEFFETKRYFSDDDKSYPIGLMLVDSGWHTDYAYAFAARHAYGVFACKGVDRHSAGETFKLFNKSTLDRIGLQMAFHINTTKMKDRISSFMNFEWTTGKLQPAWYPNFPEDFRDDYFDQFEAEERVDEYDKYNRYLRTIWKPKHGLPNHALDTYGYNLAALEIFANDCCRRDLDLAGTDWEIFWEYAKTGVFWE
jgi:phage terminase large subunit GpA-like protein